MPVLSCDFTCFLGSEDIVKDVKGEMTLIILSILLRCLFDRFSAKVQSEVTAISRKWAKALFNINGEMLVMCKMRERR